jgi:hypothetical protein
MTSTMHFREDSINRFLQASEELMRLGNSYSGNIESALESFEQRFALILQTSFLEKAIVEMLAQSFSELEKEVRANLKGIDDICIEGGQWYAFCFGTALGRPMKPPSLPEAEPPPKAKAQSGP